MKVYLDNGATTQIDPKVLKAMLPYLTEKFGNASSLHQKGQEARFALQDARETFAKLIHAKPEEIIFTSGGSESDTFAIKGIAHANKHKGNHIITTKIEHHAIEEACKSLEKDGFRITYLDVDQEGFVNLKQLEKEITDKTILVSVIHGNNEIGTIQDLNTIGNICKPKKIYFHTDAVQSFTKVPIDANKTPLDLISFSAHKIHGPKGVGAIYIRKGVNIQKLIEGGPQEFKLRAGTENIAGIVGFAEAAKLACHQTHVRRMTELRDMLIDGILKNIPYCKLNGPKGEKRLCNNINFSFKAVEGEALGAYLDSKGICTSAASACSSRSLKPSHVLLAIGMDPETANGTIRLTLSRFTTKEEMNYTLLMLGEAVNKLRKISPLAKLLGKL